jgi:outer membrane protein assembly factor BamB
MNVLWKQRVGHTDMPQVDHLVANAAGELLIGAGQSDTALMFRFDASGHPLWRQSISTFRAWLGGAAIDAEGNSYATSWFDTEVKMGNHSISGSVASSVFFLKLDAEGKRVWSHVLKGNGVQDSRLAVGPKGELILAGSFATDLHLGGEFLYGGKTVSGARSGNLFIAQYDASGDVKWAREFLGDAFVTRVAVDATGNILISGDFWDRLLLNPSAPMKVEERSGDGRGHFFAKLDASGHVRWSRHLEVQSLALSPDGSGDLYSCPLPGSGEAAIKKTAADGRVLATMMLPKDADDCESIAVDDKGMVYVAGRVDGLDTKTGEQVRRGHVLKLDGAGKVVSQITLLPDFGVTMGPQILWIKGRLLVAGITGKYADPSFYLAELTL